MATLTTFLIVRWNEVTHDLVTIFLIYFAASWSLLVHFYEKRGMIPNSIQLFAGRTGQEFNQRKGRNGTCRKPKPHAEATKTIQIGSRPYGGYPFPKSELSKVSKWAFPGTLCLAPPARNVYGYIVHLSFPV
jgi:hypothetical protein